MSTSGHSLPDRRHPANHEQGRPQLVAGEAHRGRARDEHVAAPRGHGSLFAFVVVHTGSSTWCEWGLVVGGRGRPHTQSGAARVAHRSSGHSECAREQPGGDVWRLRSPQEDRQGQVPGQAQRRLRSARSGHLRGGHSLAGVHAQDARAARRTRRRSATHQEQPDHERADQLRLSDSTFVFHDIFHDIFLFDLSIECLCLYSIYIYLQIRRGCRARTRRTARTTTS